jgi:hypothetical protein
MHVLFACLPDLPPPFPAGFATPPNATALEAGRRSMKGVATSSPEECLVVKFENSCVGTIGGTYLEGSFELWTGTCPNTSGRPVYYNDVTEVFIYFYASVNAWLVDWVCGDTAALAYGQAGGCVQRVGTSHVVRKKLTRTKLLSLCSIRYPFEYTASAWQCGNSNAGFVAMPVSVVCSNYGIPTLPCVAGTYEPSGEAPGGDCM